MRIRRISKKHSNTDIALVVGFMALAVGVVGWGLPQSTTFPCDGTFVSGWGRCEQSGAAGNTPGTCTIPTGATTCSQVITFTTPFTTTPLKSDLTLTVTTQITTLKNIITPQSYSSWYFFSTG